MLSPHHKEQLGRLVRLDVPAGVKLRMGILTRQFLELRQQRVGGLIEGHSDANSTPPIGSNRRHGRLLLCNGACGRQREQHGSKQHRPHRDLRKVRRTLAMSGVARPVTAAPIRSEALLFHPCFYATRRERPRPLHRVVRRPSLKCLGPRRPECWCPQATRALHTCGK